MVCANGVKAVPVVVGGVDRIGLLGDQRSNRTPKEVSGVVVALMLEGWPVVRGG